MFSALAGIFVAAVGGDCALSHRLVTVDVASMRSERLPDGAVVMEAEVDPGGPWTEAIPSWRAVTPNSSVLRLELQAVDEGRATKPYVMAVWSQEGERHSVKEQDDADAQVETDVLIVRSPARRLKVRAVLSPGEGGAKPTLEQLRLCLIDGGAKPASREPNRRAWGHVLEPPRRAQMDYPNGSVVCSPTSLSMVLGYWAQTLGRPELDREAPAVEKGVYDSVYQGAGNWSFNMAYAAGLPGMVAYVARFRDLRDLEDWTLAGVPVALSVAYPWLRGEREKGPGCGHLVVLVGFDANGDPVFNDPGRNAVRLTYRRSDLEAAWAHGRNTVYIVHPKTWAIPDGDGTWASGAQGGSI